MKQETKDNLMLKMAAYEPAAIILVKTVLMNKTAQRMTKKANWFQDFFGSNYKDVLQSKANEMYYNGVEPEQIKNFKSMWKNNNPAWWNLFDVYGNFGRYARNEQQMEDWRQRTMDQARAARAKANQPLPTPPKPKLVIK